MNFNLGKVESGEPEARPAAKDHLAVSMAPKRCALLAHEHAAAPTSSASSRRLLLLLALCLGAAAGEERRERHYDAVDEFNEISPQSPREVTMASRRSSVSRLSRRHSVGQSPVATTFVLGATSVSEPRNSSARLSQRRRSSVVSEPRLSPRRPSIVNSVVQNC